jgi:cobalamin transport system substrate-binding protein
MRAALAAALVAFLVGATACGERNEPTGAKINLYPLTITDATDRQVTVRREPLRIATLMPAAAQTLSALGLRSRVVDPPEGYFGSTGQLVLSRLRAARPDLIVVPFGASGLARRAAAVAASVYVAPQGSIEEVERAITQLGLLAGRPVRARSLVDAIETQRRLVASRLEKAPTVSAFVDTGFFITVPDQSLVGDLLAQAHGLNVAGANPDAGPFDLARLARLDPDVYLATSDSGTTLGDLTKNRRTRKLRAVLEKRFAIVDASLLQPGPRIGDGLLAIAKILHPDAFR